MAEIVSFIEARAAKLRKEESKLGGLFRQIENSNDFKDVPTEQLIHWAERINRASASDTIHDIVADMERVLKEQSNG